MGKVLKSKKNLIYKCSQCGGLKAFLKGDVLKVCEVCFENGKKQTWKETSRELLIVTKNVKKEIEKSKNRIDKISDLITSFCGSKVFVLLHSLFFAIWILYNIYSPNSFDPYPFGMLTLIVSLEAIILSTFVLMSQNLTMEASDIRADLDYHTDLKAEKNVAEILVMVRKIDRRLSRINSKKEN